MKAKYINPFIVSAVNLFKEFGIKKIEKGELKLIKGGISINEAAILIGITGDISGRVVYDMEMKVALGLTGLLMGEKPASFNDLAKSAIGEFANMITGKAVTMLHEQGVKFKISPPTLLTGEKIKINDINFPAIVVPIQMDFGKLIINLGLQQLG